MAFRRPLLLRVSWPRTTIAAALACHLTGILLLAGTVYALDPNKRVTQYIHTAWRTQDGSLPAGMFSITQTSDGFLWFLSLPGDVSVMTRPIASKSTCTIFLRTEFSV